MNNPKDRKQKNMFDENNPDESEYARGFAAGQEYTYDNLRSMKEEPLSLCTRVRKVVTTEDMQLQALGYAEHITEAWSPGLAPYPLQNLALCYADVFRQFVGERDWRGSDDELSAQIHDVLNRSEIAIPGAETALDRVQALVERLTWLQRERDEMLRTRTVNEQVPDSKAQTT